MIMDAVGAETVAAEGVAVVDGLKEAAVVDLEEVGEERAVEATWTGEITWTNPILVVEDGAMACFVVVEDAVVAEAEGGLTATHALEVTTAHPWSIQAP